MSITLLKLSADWCAPCKTLSATLQKMNVVYQEVDADKEPEVALKHQVRGLPTLILLKDDLEVSRKVGALTEQKLKEWFETHNFK